MHQPEDARRQPAPRHPPDTSAGRPVAAPAAAGQVLDEVPGEMLARARVVAEHTGHALLAATVLRGPSCGLQALNNALMDTFREHQDVAAFELLFELNVRPFAAVASRFLRMTNSRASVDDVLQEAFLAIFRYPTKFQPEKPNAFRNWSHSIIRNTVFRHNHADGREGIPADMLADVLEDTRTPQPARASEDAESEARCKRVYALLLMLYWHAYEHELSDRDRTALELVEVQGVGYREATLVLGTRLENFKMIVCRARKKIYQSMVRVLGTRLP
ncbi:MAG: sigma-70 family RNA polymerase sigma factor [Planctomycetes bacterium]|nr:sigma-70 family RNA polymerase sigma factor [Planctomycetota bacterium]